VETRWIRRGLKICISRLLSSERLRIPQLASRLRANVRAYICLQPVSLRTAPKTAVSIQKENTYVEIYSFPGLGLDNHRRRIDDLSRGYRVHCLWSHRLQNSRCDFNRAWRPRLSEWAPQLRSSGWKVGWLIQSGNPPLKKQ